MWVSHADAGRVEHELRAAGVQVEGVDYGQVATVHLAAAPDALDLEAMAERTAAASADCTTATLHAEATPGGKLWQWLTCDTAYVADSTMIDSSEFPDTKTITTATRTKVSICSQS